MRIAGKWLGGAAACVALVGAFAYGCGPTAVPLIAPPPPPPLTAAPLVLPAPTATASETLPPAPPVEVGFDPKTVQPILDDPRLAEVKAAVTQEAFVKAAELLGAAIAGLATAPTTAATGIVSAPAATTGDASAPAATATGVASAPVTATGDATAPAATATGDATAAAATATAATAPAGTATGDANVASDAAAKDLADRAAWLYQLGKIRAQAGDPIGAAKAYEESAALEGSLADYARYQAAEIYARAGRDNQALALVRKIAPGLGIADELELVLADALEGSGDMDAAAVAWRAFLKRSPRPSSWVNVTLKFAGALLKHPSEARNEEVVKLTRTIIDGSSSAGVGEAKELEKKALQRLPAPKRKAFETLSSDDLLTRARRLVAAGQVTEALKVTELLVKGARVPKSKDKACEAALLRGEAFGKLKRKAESGDTYEAAIETCTGAARHVDALYNTGKVLSVIGRQAEGAKRLEEVEKTYPQHRLADDARVLRARAARAGGDEATFAKLLRSLPDDYPDGDLVNDGLFELAVHYAEKRAWSNAIPILARAFSREKDKRERIYYSAGRFGYFLGRALIETGSEAMGKEYLAGVIRNYPLTYYMTLANARLTERDPAGAKRALDEAMAREATEAFFVPAHPSLKSPEFLRAVELVRQGDVKLSRGELDLLGVGNRTAPREVLWASALLLAKVGASTQSHSLLRSAATTSSDARTELTDWLEHYPAGRWRTAWELSFPRPYADIVSAAAAQAGIPEALAYAIMREESAFDPRVVSPAQAVGLMQLILPTAKRMAKPLNLPSDAESLKKPQINVALGCRYLGILRKQFPDNALLAIPGYNAGGGAPKKWLDERAGYDFDVWVERIPYDETQKYTKRVLGSMAAYELLYWPDRPSEARATPRAAGSNPTAVASLPALPPAPVLPPAEAKPADAPETVTQ